MSKPRLCLLLCATVGTLLLLSAVAEAAKIGEVTDTEWKEQAVRFWRFQDPAVRYALWGSVAMGISCGLLGSFLLVRKLALIGDALSHAVLPGVALGFLWNLSKDPLAIFIGATAVGLLGMVCIHFIQQTTHIKEDSAFGMVLAGFYAVGICLLTMIQRLPTGNKSGIDKFLFGQMAALGQSDIILMTCVMLGIALILFVGYKEFLISSFDWGFASSLGVPVRSIHYLLLLLLTFTVVVSLQATGVVLVSAMLIIPAATAYLLTDRMHHMLLLAAAFGVASGVMGTFFSFLGNDLPTGPFMVVGAASVFTFSFCFAPRYGWFPRWRRRWHTAQRIRIENTLKAFYHVMEAHTFQSDTIRLTDLAARLRQSMAATQREVAALKARNLITYSTVAQKQSVVFTPKGWLRACQIVRNHRLWELYLTHAAHYKADHVHDDAEQIEHILGEKTVRALERRLNYPQRDPHGKPIPSQKDMERFGPPSVPADSAAGYYKGVS